MLVVTTVSYYSPDLLSFNTVLHSSRSGDDGLDLQNSSNSGQYLGGTANISYQIRSLQLFSSTHMCVELLLCARLLHTHSFFF